MGGFGAVLLVALFVMGKWLLKRITAALDSYTTAYLQQKAAIDARIERLEQLAEEQAKLTRTVETIKDEIAAQRKSQDNRWEFKKNIYVNLINATSDLIGYFVGQLPTAELNRRLESVTEEDKAKIVERQTLLAQRFEGFVNEFIRYSNLAPLATADSVVAALAQVESDVFGQIDFASPDCEAKAIEAKLALESLLLKLYASGRRDLWETSEPGAKAEAVT